LLHYVGNDVIVLARVGRHVEVQEITHIKRKWV